ncbi:MAG TPA: hypothetical protein VNW04_23490 [Puia sp.]|nr:hypothetical protein [Puia sp.]
METFENELKPSESLQVIMDVIGRTKENIKEHGYLFLLWGWLIAIASILFFLLHTYTTSRLYFLPFPILALTGIIVTLVSWSKRAHSSETYIAYYLKRLWQALGLGFIVVVFMNVVKGNPPFPYTILLGGIGTLASGLVLKFRPLTIGGFIFLAMSIASIFVTNAYAPLLQAVAVVTGYLIPGYLLKLSKAQ